MSTSTAERQSIPQWDLADRMAKALRESRMSVQQMADYLEVHRNTVSAWLHGRTPPSSQTVRLWALRTGVPYDWVRDGAGPDETGPDGDGGGAVESHLGESNSRPIHYEGTGSGTNHDLSPAPVIPIRPSAVPVDKPRRVA